jgi:hypothetical protein
MKLQRLGGYAAIATVCVLIGHSVLSNLYLRCFEGVRDFDKAFAVAKTALAELAVINLVWIVLIILMLIVFLALHERMQANAPCFTRIALIAASAATAMCVASGFILSDSNTVLLPTPDESVYRALSGIAGCLKRAGGEFYGWAFLLMGCAVLSTRAFSRVLGCLFLLVGILFIPKELFQGGIAIVNPIAALLAAVCFVWLGVVLLREKQ